MKVNRLFLLMICIILFYGCKPGEIPGNQKNNTLWETKTPMKTKRAFHSMAEVQGKLYVIGGATGGSNEFKGTSSVEMYDTGSDQWSLKADMPYPVILSCAVALNDKIYVFGGEEGESFKSSAGLLVYDCITNQWLKKNSMNIPRSFHCAAALNGKIYAIGGRENNNQISTKPKESLAVYTIEEYDVQKDKWTVKSILPFKHFAIGAVTLNNKIYILSDTTNNSMMGESAILEEYDPVSNTFSRKANLKPSKCDAAMTVYNNKIYIFGGWRAGALFTAEVYDPGTNSWAEISSMPNIVQNHQAVSYKDRIYITGGINYLQDRTNEKKDNLLIFNPKYQAAN